MRAGSVVYIHMARHARVGRLTPPLRLEICAPPQPRVWNVPLGVRLGVWYLNTSSADIAHGTVAIKYVF